MRSSKSSLFLMELVIVILFFSLSSAVCIQLFVKAHSIDKQTVEMNHSVIWIQNLSESFRAYDGNFISVKNLYSDSDVSTSDSELILLFDNKWKETTDRYKAAYRISMHAYCDSDSTYPAAFVSGAAAVSAADGMLYSADISIENAERDNDVLYSQHIDHYVSRKGAK